MNSHREGTWLGSPNFSPNRDGHEMAVAPSYVVIHTMVGTVAGANSRFQQAGQASAHYGVGEDGHLVQWVDERDAAWHAGIYGVNLDSIGIEHEDNGDYNGVRPDALYASSAALVKDICTRYGIPIQHGSVSQGKSGIIRHNETGYATGCPDALDFDRIVRQAGGTAPAPVPPAPAPQPAPVPPTPKPPLPEDPSMLDVCTHPGTARRDLAGIGENGAMYHGVFSTGDLAHVDGGNYEQLGGRFIGGVHCEWRDANTFEVIGVGLNHQVYRNTWAASSWSGWKPLSPGLFGTLPAK